MRVYLENAPLGTVVPLGNVPYVAPDSKPLIYMLKGRRIDVLKHKVLHPDGGSEIALFPGSLAEARKIPGFQESPDAEVASATEEKPQE